MPHRPVLVTPRWTLERPNARAQVQCAIALVQGAIDDGLYDLRLALNGEPLYGQVFDSPDDVHAEADDIRQSLVEAGWRDLPL